jgi:hypothetical protein
MPCRIRTFFAHRAVRFLGVRRACLGAGLYSYGLKYDRVATICSPASWGGNMCATLCTFEHNNLAGMTLIPRPNMGKHCFDHGRETSNQQSHLFEKWWVQP